MNSKERLRTMTFNTHLRGTPIRVRVYAAQIVQPFVLEFDVFREGVDDDLLCWVLEPDELAALCGEVARHRFGLETGFKAVERLVAREVADTPAMRADPALPVFVAVMARIERLMRTDPEHGTTEGAELHALVDLAEVYERRWFPEFSSKPADPVSNGEILK